MRPLLLIAAGLFVAFGLPPMPDIPKWVWVVPAKADAAVYVYEKDSTAVPSGVMAGLDKLNRQGIVATLIEDDVTDGSGEVPEQYKAALEAGRNAGLPSLVMISGSKVVRTVKEPLTVEDVLEAAR